MEEYYVIGMIPIRAEASVECPSECAFAELCWRLIEEEPVVFPWLCLTETLEEKIREIPAVVWSINKFIRRDLQIVDHFTFVVS